MDIHRFIWLTIVIATCNAQSAEEHFNLFDADRGKPPPPATSPLSNPFTRAPKQPEPPPPPPPLLPQKDFMLLGTARMGNQWIAILQAPDGKQFIQRLNRAGRTSVEGYPDYALLGVEARQIRLEYPANAPCRNSNIQNGIQCSSDTKTATLNIMQKEAVIPSPTSMASPAQQPAVSNLTPEEARKKREEERQKRRELYKNFKRQVIKDEDVPPGMRVVRTPFGDRLVPDNKN